MRYKNEFKQNIKMRLHMGRSSGNREDFRLELTDDSSGCVIAEVRLDAQGIADLISNRYTEPMEADYYANPNIGKKHECKSIQVLLTDVPGAFDKYENYDRDARHIQDRAEEIEPGWVADREKYNGNYRTRDKGAEAYKVILRRYI